MILDHHLKQQTKLNSCKVFKEDINKSRKVDCFLQFFKYYFKKSLQERTLHTL